MNEKWKEVDIVVGVLTVQDSFLNQRQYSYPVTQYVRISKAFLNNNSSALEIAKNNDSIYHKQPLDVFLDEYLLRNDSILLKSYPLEKETSIAKDSGIFAYPNQLLYKTPLGFRLKLDKNDSLFVYKIRIRNTKTGVTVSGKTKTVAAADLRQYYSHRFDFHFEVDQKHRIQWYTMKNAKIYDVAYTFFYTEYEKITQKKLRDASLKWTVANSLLTNSLEGGEPENLSFDGQAFYEFIASSIKEDQNIIRKFTKNVILNIDAGGEDLYYYIEVNKPSLGIVQKKPEYTNITNGYGIFSGRSTVAVSLPISKQTIDSLGTHPLTARLNFTR